MIIGFDKYAKKKEQSIGESMSNSAAGGAAMAGGIATSNTIAGVGLMPFLTSGSSSPEKYERAKALAKKILSHDGYGDIDIEHMEGGKMSDATGPISKNKWLIRSSQNTSPGMVAHETGHIKNYENLRKLKIDPRTAILLGRVAAPLAGLAGAAYKLKDRDSDTISNAWKPIALGFTPTLVDEGAASVRGLNSVRKLLGSKAALKELPKLLAAFGTYASIPLGAYGLSKMWGNKARADEQEEVEYSKQEARKKAARRLKRSKAA